MDWPCTPSTAAFTYCASRGGSDRVVGYGALPRFTAAGLIFADGARIRLVPFSRLQ